MAAMKQTSLFAFDDAPISTTPKWLEGYDGKHKMVFRMDAEALTEDINKMPSGKGSWLRCLEVDHSRSYESQFKDWDACIWHHNGIGMKKMVRSDGEVMDCIDPHPYGWHFMDEKQVHEWIYEPLKEAWIESDVLHIGTESGEYLAEILPDDRISRYDLHPYDPTTDLEHFAIECYKHRLPREMMSWRESYVFGTPVLRPFSRNITVEDAKKADLMGRISDSIVPNAQFDQICECAEKIGIRLKLPYDVPVLRNLAMYPAEENCSSCMRKRNRNPDCRNAENQAGCRRYIWNRTTAAKRYTLKKTTIREF